MNELSDKLCGCGCGGFTSLAIKTIAKKGIKKGDPLPFIKGHKYLLGRRFECTQCGKVAYKRPSRQKRNKHSFCSRECADTHHSLNMSGENNPAWNGGKKRVRCSICEKEIERTPALIKDGKSFFCSTKCAGIWKSINKSGEKIKVQCAHCGNDIYKTPSRIKTEKNYFCNSTCMGLWQANRVASDHPAWKGGLKEVACDQCGKIFGKRPCDIKKDANNFCSKQCLFMWSSINCRGDKTSAWRGGISLGDYCPTWKDSEFKSYILERDGHRCQNPDCWGTVKRLARHHINYNKKDCKLENLICLCTSCNSRANVDRAWHESYYQAIMDKRFNIRSIKNEYSTENNIKGVEIWKENKAHSPVLLF